MDNVNKPKHYELDGIPGVEVKDVIKAVLGKDTVSFYLGNVLKYMLRFKKKNGLEDLKKARLYLDWAITDYGEDIPVKNEVTEELLEDILKNTTAYSAPGRQTVFAYTGGGPNSDDPMEGYIKQEVKKSVAVSIDDNKYDEYILSQVIAEESKKWKENDENED